MQIINTPLKKRQTEKHNCAQQHVHVYLYYRYVPLGALCLSAPLLAHTWVSAACMVGSRTWVSAAWWAPEQTTFHVVVALCERYAWWMGITIMYVVVNLINYYTFTFTFTVTFSKTIMLWKHIYTYTLYAW